MTYDELLAKIDSKVQICTCEGWDNNCWEDDNQPWKALRAVVELHQQLDDNSCHHCATWYPCTTIQAIEKELANG